MQSNPAVGQASGPGFQMAGDELMTETGRKIIILLSDGEDGDTSKIDGVLRQLHQSNIYVYTIGFGGADTEYLSYIANSCKESLYRQSQVICLMLSMLRLVPIW